MTLVDALPRIWLAPGHAPGQKLSEKERYEKVSRLVSFQIPDSREGTGTITYPTKPGSSETSSTQKCQFGGGYVGGFISDFFCIGKNGGKPWDGRP